MSALAVIGAVSVAWLAVALAVAAALGAMANGMKRLNHRHEAREITAQAEDICRDAAATH